MFCKLVTSLMCWLNHNIRCSHRPGWQSLINTKVASTDYPGLTVWEDLVANRLCLHFCRKASWKCNSSSHLILAYTRGITSTRQHLVALNPFYRDSLESNWSQRMEGHKPQKISTQTSTVVKNFPVRCLAHPAFHVCFCYLLTGDLSLAFLPGLYNWPQKL